MLTLAKTITCDSFMKWTYRAGANFLFAICASASSYCSAEEDEYYFDVGSFSGIWEGRLTTTHPPGDSRQFDVRMTYEDDSPVFFLKEPEESEFSTVGPCFGFRLRQDRYICNTNQQGEIWTEVFSIDQVSLTETTSHIYVRRVVDNDLSEVDNVDEDSEVSRHFSTSFDGKLEKKWTRVEEPKTSGKSEESVPSS